jgi:phosphatidate cytidylyltransferase
VAGLFVALAVLASAVLFRGWVMPARFALLVGPLYVGLPLGLIVAAHAWRGWHATLLLLTTVVVSDTGQYYSGRAFGRRPLAPTISPKKTIEGAVGGLVCGVVVMTVAGAWALPDASVPALGLLGCVLVAFGIAGDLFESRLKRLAGLKDSSTLIPGHGGVLDRIDALLFASPVFYLFARSAW